MLTADSSVLGWRKSSFSESGNCVEVGANKTAIAVRDTKNHDRSELIFLVHGLGGLHQKNQGNEHQHEMRSQIPAAKHCAVLRDLRRLYQGMTGRKSSPSR